MERENKEYMVEKIHFNRKIYTKKAIDNSIKAFSHLARFRVAKYGGYFVVSADAIDADVKSVFKDEFCDFVLEELKKA